MAQKTLQTGSTIEFEFLGIGTALKRHRLKVPANQREYSWEEKQIGELFRDLGGAIRANKPSYFLGTIVLTAGNAREVDEVADGQQRLATTSILLATIRDLFLERNDSRRANYIEQNFLHGVALGSGEIEPYLTLNVDDNDFFRHTILPRTGEKKQLQPGCASHQLIQDAATLSREYMNSILKPYAEAARIETLNGWVKFIENSAQIIILTVPDELNAFVMFETLNDRGLKTSQADLLKNYLFAQAEDRLSEAQQKWSKMRGMLETLDLDDVTMIYLRHLASALYGATREREVFERIKANVSGKSNSVRFLDTLAAYAEDYVAILNPEHTKWNSYPSTVRRSLKTLHLLGAEQIRPLMLAVARHFPQKEAASALRLFVSWIVRFLIVGGGRGGTLDAAYADRAKDICEEKIVTAKALSKSMESLIPTDAQFEAEFVTARVSKAALARYYLRALEMTHRNDPEPEFVQNDDPTVMTLEHVLPQNPSKGWSHIRPETAEAYYKRIGNMVLLKASVNSNIGDGSFKDKLTAYEESASKLTEMIAAEKSWGPDEIDSRQKKLAALAVRAWALRA